MNVDVRTVLAWLRNENHPLNGVKHANMWRIPESNLAKFLSGEYYGN